MPLSICVCVCVCMCVWFRFDLRSGCGIGLYKFFLLLFKANNMTLYASRSEEESSFEASATWLGLQFIAFVSKRSIRWIALKQMR